MLGNSSYLARPVIRHIVSGLPAPALVDSEERRHTKKLAVTMY